MDKKKYDKTKYPNIYKHKENGTYAVDLSLGYDYRGKRIRTTRTGLKTEKEAKSIIRDLEYQQQAKNSIIFEYKFEDLLDEYWNWCLYSDKQKERTIDRKKSMFNQVILPYFKGGKLAKLDGNEQYIEKWHKYLMENTNVSNETKNTYHRKLSAYFNWLLKIKHVININPCSYIKKFPEKKHEIRYYDDSEIKKLRNTIIDYQKTKPLISKRTLAVLDLIYSMGLRFGELQGLKISDFDYNLLSLKYCREEIVKIHINRNIIRGKNGLEVSTGKTYDSLDACYVGNKVINSIIDYLNCCKALGATFKNSDYLFKNNKGIPLSQHTIRTNIDFFIKEAKLPHRQIKEIRNSTASYLISNGSTLKEVQEQLRHTNFKTTEKHYAKLFEENKKNRAKMMNNAI